ncbi:MAG TPA: serine hydrolase domain-containing protein, partial [Steroidobacteraceae bacterium]|nr:serine hydrolase domain-containing protein [Steroidobacteraceae bacterium]
MSTFPLAALATRALSVLVVLSCLSDAQAAPASITNPEKLGLSSGRLTRLDDWMREEIAQKRKAGAVVLIARHGKVAWEKAYGMADMASGKPMRTDSMFRLFSMTKPVTSVALLTLYEQGRFQLTDPLEKYLPAFRGVKVYAGVDAAGKAMLRAPKRQITIQDVLRHTAGFVYGYFDDTPVDRAYRDAGIEYAKLESLSELVDKVAAMPLLYDPGERWVYSFAHDVQAYLVERLSGMRFDEYCRRVIFEPLGMRDTVFGVPAERADRYATDYKVDSAGSLHALSGQEDIYSRFAQRPFGGISLSSTARDYLRFAQMLLNGGELDGVHVLGRKTVELMASDNLPPGTDYRAP